MELQSKDGSVVQLSESSEKELGGGAGLASHARRVEEDSLDGGERNGRSDLVDIGSGSRGNVADSESQKEEEGITEAVARWQQRRRERLEVEQRKLNREGSASAAAEGTQDPDDRVERLGAAEGEAGQKSEQNIFNDKAVSHVSSVARELDRQRTDEDKTDPVKKYGFVVEDSEFEPYGKKGLDTSKWEWQIGKRSLDVDDDDEDDGGDEEAGKQHARSIAGKKTKQKAKPGKRDVKVDDDDEWEGDSEGERELLSKGRSTEPRQRGVQTRAHDWVTTSKNIADSRKKRKVLDSNRGEATASRQVMVTKQLSSTKQKTRAPDMEEDEEDEDGNLGGFIVDDVEEGEEIGDEEDEWTEEDEDEDDEAAEADEMNKGKGGGFRIFAVRSPSRRVKDRTDPSGERPMCKYGSSCFRFAGRRRASGYPVSVNMMSKHEEEKQGPLRSVSSLKGKPTLFGAEETANPFWCSMQFV